MRYSRILLLSIALTPMAYCSSPTDRDNSISLFGGFITSSKLFQHPNDADDIVRNQYLPLNNVWSGGFDFRHDIRALRIEIGLSMEFITKTDLLMEPLREPSVSILVPVKN